MLRMWCWTFNLTDRQHKRLHEIKKKQKKIPNKNKELHNWEYVHGSWSQSRERNRVYDGKWFVKKLGQDFKPGVKRGRSDGVSGVMHLSLVAVHLAGCKFQTAPLAWSRNDVDVTNYDCNCKTFAPTPWIFAPCDTCPRRKSPSQTSAPAVDQNPDLT